MNRALRQVVLVACSLALVLLPPRVAAQVDPPPPQGPPVVQFTDVSVAAGVANDVCNSSTAHSLGINWVDLDRDGWLDLFIVTGGPNRWPNVYRNLGDGTFELRNEWLPTIPGVEMSGSRFADVDNDGDADLFVYTDHPDLVTNGDNAPDGPPNFFFRNQLAELGFEAPDDAPMFLEQAALAGVDDLADPPWGELPAYRAKTAGFVDYDRDGWVDLYVGHLVMNHGGEPSNRDRLYRNRGDGTFEDVTEAVGLPGPDAPAERFRGTLAFLAAHLDDDLWPDLYVVHAGGRDPQPFINDFIYRNLGPTEGGVVFEEITDQLPGIGDDAEAGMGIDVADVDLDGDWDLYLSDLLNTNQDALPRGNVLYLGQGDGSFADNSAPAAGVVGHNSWGVNFFDVDLDGDEDLYVATTQSAGTELLYLNDGTGHFTNVADSAGLVTFNTRGSATADFDHDGDLDLAVVNQAGRVQLFRNDTTTAGHWIQLELVGSASNRDGIGTLIVAETESATLRRQVTGGSSAHSQDTLRVHFGLGESTEISRLRVFWPSGQVDTFDELAVDRFYRLTEGLFFGDGFESGDLSAWSSVEP